MGLLLTLWTIRAACLAMLLVIAIRARAGVHRHDSESSADLGQVDLRSRADNLARWIWTAGFVLAGTHFFLAMGNYHGWSFSSAYQDTAEKTERLIGWKFGGGIYFNYLFLLVWTADCGWWWFSAVGYANRNKIANLIVYGYMIFIAFNAAVVFVSGPPRWIGLIVSVTFVSYLAMETWNRKRLPAKTIV